MTFELKGRKKPAKGSCNLDPFLSIEGKKRSDDPCGGRVLESS
jgi:hypothetical protein